MTDADTLLPGLERLPTLTAERVQLRALARNDAPALFAVFSDPRVMRYWSSPPMTAVEQAEGLIEQIDDWFARRGGCQWGVVESASGSVIGTVTLHAFALPHKRCEIGYVLGSAHWGRGFAREALARLLRFAFDELGLARIEADVDPRNAASVRLVERLGFRREGLLRARWRVAGEVQDSALYGLLRDEFLPAAITHK